jgi:SAM-dependent methyltransferase
MPDEGQPGGRTRHLIFDRALLRQRQRRAREAGAVNFLLDHVAADLKERLGVVTRQFAVAADIGSPATAVTKALLEHPRIESVVALRADASAPVPAPLIVADEEALPLRDASLDLAVSVLSLHFVNDLPGALVQIRRALRPDGLFLAAMLGGDTLTELRQAFTQAEAEVIGGASPRIAPFGDVRQLGGLLQRAGFALPVADVDRITVRYDTTLELMLDLRRMGATNVLVDRLRTPLSRSVLIRLAEIYADRFADADGRLRATFEIVWLSGWAPHESQQQPLRPGSAKSRLADALGVKEHSTGEKSET